MRVENPVMPDMARAMAMSPAMQAIEHHRKAGPAGQLNIRTKPGAEF
jgi:hypothetical protein